VIRTLLAVLCAVAQGESGSKDEVRAVTAVDRGAITGPQDDPFNMPSDVAVGRDGVLYVLDGVNHRVVVYDAEGRSQFQFGSHGAGVGQFAYPLGIAAGPEGDIYVADSGNHRLQVFTAEGKWVEAIPLAPTASGAPPDPTDVVVDPIRQRLYIADNENHCIVIYDLAGRRFEPVWGGPGQGQRQFRFPFLMDLSAEGYLFVVESINTRVQVLNPDSKFVGFIGGWGIDPGQLFRPKGVALWRDRVFVTDSYRGNVQVFDLSGRFLGALTDATGAPMDFATPTGLAVDPSRNRLYVVELKAHRVRRLDLEAGPSSEAASEKLKTGSIGSTGPVGPVSGPPAGKDILPNSSKECAICHIRWVQAFDRGQPQGAMHDVLERQAGSGDMCLSCHDGSVADSRFKIWSTRHHATDIVPSPAVHIPTEIFPLDDQGHMTCATCHTAHAVPGDSDLRTVIFLRQPNVDSSLCLSCHAEHAQKSERHHPLGRRDSPIPQIILDAGGKTSADGHTVLCQTCHEPHGARNAWMLVLPPSQLCVACHTEKAPEVSPPAGAPMHRIGHSYAGFKPPKALLDEKATFGPNGELSCLSCHRLHDASGVWPLLIRKNEDSSLCLGCHEKEQAVLGSPHDLRLSSPQAMNTRGQNAMVSGPCGACHRIHGWARQVLQTDRPHSAACLECHELGGPGSTHRPYVDAHPVGVPVPGDVNIPLPLDPASRVIGCLTCHDPHIPRPPAVPEDRRQRTEDRGQKTEDRGQKAEDSTVVGHPSSVLRPPSSVLGPPSSVLRDPSSGSFPSPSSDFLFLRRPGSQLCVLCHSQTAPPHDPARFSPSVRETLGVHSLTGSCRVCHTAHDAQGPHLWARPPADSSEGPATRLCRTCHDGHSVTKPQDTHHPLAPLESLRPSAAPAGPLDPTNPVGPVPEVSCITCHNPHESSDPATRFRRPLQSLCLDCHEGERASVQGGVHDGAAHDWGKDLRFVSQGLCLDCHPIHGPKSEAGLWASLGGKNAGESLCDACHRPGAPGPVVHTPHVGLVRSVPVRASEGVSSLKGQVSSSGDVNHPLPTSHFTLHTSGERVQCASCHDIHRPQNPHLLRTARQDSALCVTCHPGPAQILGMPHDMRKSAPQVRNIHGATADQVGPCGVCHLVHPPAAGGGTWTQPLPLGDTHAGGLCTGCHRQGGCAESRVPRYADHPEVALVNRLAPEHPDYMPTFDEQGRPSLTGAISCPTCHQVHPTTRRPDVGLLSSVLRPPSSVFLPSSDPTFFPGLRPGHQTLCADCHGLEAPWRFLYYHRASRNPHGGNNRQQHPTTD
jgi:predicted CXXCH cytochrome family protein